MDCLKDDFEKGKLLGGRYLTLSPLNHGSFGMVFTARDIQTGDDVAIKCIAKPGSVTSDMANCLTAIATDECSEELPIHTKISGHPNIVNLLNTFETEHHTWMVLELCNNGDLYEAIRIGRGPLETEHVRDFMLQLVEAIEHLHCNSVYHRDIKPENIFLTSAGSMKLGDFGLATTETWSTEFAVGSDRYMAPEQFESSVYGYGYSTASADIWAIGIVLLNVLFQRNPFATPTQKDPLFADFARDRQSLFDVFPNMSQDTFNVLVHSLAIDPANRSLPAVRDALQAAVTFTTDDEALDDFCTASQTDLIPTATAGREPLRTPSITSPAMSTGDSFPWTSLLKSPEKQGRQLSTIRDEELFPGSSVESGNGFNYGDPDEVSLTSNVDSGLGMSFKSTKSAKSTASRMNNFVGSLPISFSRPDKTSPYGTSGFSKSWSDLWDEEEELAQDQCDSLDCNRAIDMSRASTAKPSTPQVQAINVLREESDGSLTPRQSHVQPATPSEECLVVERATLPKRASSSILDKWAALGNLRRAKVEPSARLEAVPAAPAPSTPQKSSRYADAFASLSPFGSSRKIKQQQQQ
ncbi:kinase-like protein, partial [Polychaeton citri CBS 116435]